MKSRSNPTSVYCLLAIVFCLLQQTVQGQVKANFTSVVTEGCAPLVVQFNDQSTDNPTAWQWDLGNGTISLFQHPSTVYFLPGKYPIKLVVKNAAGVDSIVKQQFITVYANPVAAFTASDSIGCFPLKVQFSDQSLAPGATVKDWQWDFGDGHTSTAQNPQHTYLNSGNHTVTLKIVTDKGCSHTFSKEHFIRVSAGVTTNFYDSSDKNCSAPVTTYFKNLSAGPGNLTYTWDFGDGKTSTEKNPVHIYTTNGSYNVSLVTISDEGCRDTLRMQGLVKPGSTVTQFNMPDSICVDQAVAITNSGTPSPVNAKWNFGDGTTSTVVSPGKAYSSVGTYFIKLTNTYEKCIDSITKPVKVFAKPVAAFTSDRQYSCSVPASIQFNTTAIGKAYRWEFGDGNISTLANPLHTYTAFGNFTVKLFVTGAGGCVDSVIKNDYILLVRPQVQISNLPARGCLPLTVPFAATVASGSKLSNWHWEFGDGSSSTLEAPEKTYDKEGTYTVKLFFTTEEGCKDSLVMRDAVRVSKKPVVEFSALPTSACAVQSIQFSNSTTPVGTKWFWEFGDGGTSTLQNPLYKYNDTGYFNVRLIVWNNECSDTLTKQRYVHIDPPIARFTTDLKCTDKYLRSFTNKSIGAKTWLWEFGDGGTSTDYDATHRYAAKGTYKVKLIVSNGSCVDSTISFIIVADEKLDFITNAQEICKGRSVNFNLVNYEMSYISRMNWHYGDGSSTTHAGSNAHTYAAPGNYRVVLRYTDVNGCSDSVIKQQPIRVYGPSADFNVQQQTVCIGATAVFNDKSKSDGTHPITEWNWSYGDGTRETKMTAPFIHSYADTGTYNVRLLVKDSYGCVDSITKPAAIIISKPRAAFATVDTNSCPGKPIVFSNTSTGAKLQYRWNFGDGQTSTLATPVHMYAATGIYTVKLSVIDQYGCTDSITRLNYVYISIPAAGFTVSDSVSSCPPLQVQFTSQAQNYVSVKWEFGDGSGSVIENPEHFYNMPGVYYARQIIRGPGGCTDTVVKKMVVKGPNGVFTYAPLTGCKPLTVSMKASSTDRVSFVWDFNDGSVLPTKDSNVNHTYTTAGSFIPKLILIDSAGCRVPIVGKDTLQVIGVTARAEMNEYRVCNEGFIQFNDRSVANDYITGHRWDFGDGSTSTEANPRHYYKNEGTYTVKYIAITSQGCRDTLKLIDTVKVWPKPDVTILGDKEACEPAILGFRPQVIAGDSSQFKWDWNFGNGQRAYQSKVDSQQYKAAGNYTVQLKVSFKEFCHDTATHAINIRPLPNTFAGNDTFVCRDNPVLLKATGADKYVWSAAAGLSCTDCATPRINPTDNITYVVTGYTNYGCVKKDSIIVRVRQRFNVNVSRGDTLCQGESMGLLATGAELYQWFPADGLNNANIPNPKATPQVTTVYTVIGKDRDGCFADSAKIPVKVYPMPRIFAGNDTTVSTGSTIQLHTTSSPDITKWKWSPAAGLSCIDCPSPGVAVKGTVTYRVDVVNEGGCRGFDEVTVQAVCNGANYFLPNTFSPNGDGSNDIFYVRGKGVNRIHSLKIFNRWGQIVFEKRDLMPNDASAGWDGTFNGRKADIDVYIYIAEVICENSQIVPLKGDVTLIR